MLRRVVWQRLTDVSEVFTVSIIRAIATMLQVVSTCSLVQTDRRFTYAYCLYHQRDDEGSKHV
jgi:hypothetical protein